MKDTHRLLVATSILLIVLITVFSQRSYGIWSDCWDNPRQCHGDADGIIIGFWWVNPTDVAILRACFPLPVYSWELRYNPCADFNRDCIIDNSDVSIIDYWLHKSNVPADCSGKLRINSMAGKILLAGSNYTITWDDLSGYCTEGELFYSINNGSDWTQIDPNLKSGCSCDWTVPDVNSEQCLVEIRYTGEFGWLFTDTTGPFIIYQCKLTTDSDLNSDCYIDFYDFAIIAADWLVEGGTDINDLSSFAQSWCDCGNPYDPTCDN